MPFNNERREFITRIMRAAVLVRLICVNSAKFGEIVFNELREEEAVTKTLLVASCLLAFGANAALAQERRRVEVGIPKHYTVKSKCIPNRGFFLVAEAPGHEEALPLVALLVFKGEVIGLMFEALARDGWRPWYD